MNLIRSVIATAAIFTIAGAATAATVTLQSQSVRTVITDVGVMNSLRYDSTATGNFPANTDYVSPGIPFEGFEVRYAGSTGGTVVNANSNSGGGSITGTTALAPLAGFDFAALWSGSTAAYDITHLFYFDNGDERVNIRTTVTAKTNLTDVRVSRAVDPDPDNFPGGSAATNNQRGIVAQSVPVTDFVGSLGSISGLPLGLYYDGALTHNTGIVSNCCSVTNADTYLTGGQLGNASSGDHGIGMGFALGSMTTGQSISWNYAYVMGGSLGTIDIPGGTVSAPTTLALVGLGLLVAGFSRRRA